MTEPLVHPLTLLRALVRGGLLGTFYGLGASCGTDQLGGWALALGALLGLSAAAPAWLELTVAGRERRWTRDLAAAGAAAVVAGAGLVLATLQLAQLHGRLSGAGAPFAGLADALDALVRYRLEVAALVVAWAAPFGPACLARLRGWRLRTAIPVTLLAAAAALWTFLGAAGFVGLPQPGWLLRAPWFPPLAGTLLLVHPVLGAFTLPLAAAAGDRLVPARPRPDAAS